MSTTFMLAGGTIPVGPFSFGPFAVPSSATELDLKLDISNASNNLTLQAAFLVSYDGGATFVDGGSTTGPIVNGTVPTDTGTTGTLELICSFNPLRPTNNRQVKMQGQVTGTALILGTSTLTLV